MDEIEAKDINWKKYFPYARIVKRKYEINIFINKKNEGFCIEKTKGENSLKVYITKQNQFDLMLRSLMIVYGNEKEKKYFENGFNKLYFDTDEELCGILAFLSKKYLSFIFKYFESDDIHSTINEYFSKLQKPEVPLSKEELQNHIIDSISYSKKVKFTLDGDIFLKETSN